MPLPPPGPRHQWHAHPSRTFGGRGQWWPRPSEVREAQSRGHGAAKPVGGAIAAWPIKRSKPTALGQTRAASIKARRPRLPTWRRCAALTPGAGGPGARGRQAAPPPSAATGTTPGASKSRRRSAASPSSPPSTCGASSWGTPPSARATTTPPASASAPRTRPPRPALRRRSCPCRWSGGLDRPCAPGGGSGRLAASRAEFSNFGRISEFSNF
mmetsp:Transcript_5245/g.15205  ORF Transcript_5245/g.15205 Transcript_5245/m.15205 type:complete len:213 (+) Transcript_5245:659-1297(+)